MSSRQNALSLNFAKSTRLPRLGARSILSLALLAGAAHPAALRAADATESRFEKAYELTGVTKLRVQNVNGPVHLESWDRNYLRVVAVKKVKGGRSEQTLRDTEIRVTKDGPTITVETVLPKRGRGLEWLFSHGDHGAEVSYDLLMPAALAADIETVNGRVTAERHTGALNLNTVNGTVHVENHDGPVKVNTVNGSVEVLFAGALRPAELETVNGSVIVGCTKDSSIRYELQTVNGRIQSDFANLTVEGKWGPKEARGSLNGGRDRLAIETVNGEVRLRLTEPAVALKGLGPRP
ncbi:MAG: DUF4097 family beta strand repeat-containing protein [Thermoanaerobaculia bacterium]